jgi:DUF1707 SHOCT-like domain
LRYAEAVARVPSLRASDSDREQVAERLRIATGEGRLATDELEERLDALYHARTYGELEMLVADLPDATPKENNIRLPAWVGAAAAITVLIAILGMLADARHSAYAGAAAATARHYQWRFADGPMYGPHHGFASATPAVGLLMIFAICAAVGWLLMRSSADT